MKDKIKRWYGMGLWSGAKVRDAVEKGILTAEETAELMK